MSSFMSVKRAAARLDVTRRHIYNLIQDGKIEAIRIGEKGLRVSVQSLDEFVSSRLVDPQDRYGMDTDDDPGEQRH